jgi:hypothetical protein
VQAKENIEVRGVEVDAQTRCAHWRSSLDIVAINEDGLGDPAQVVAIH